MRNYTVVAFLWLLVACGSTPAPTAQQVIDRFSANGINITQSAPAPAQANSPLPKSFQERVAFQTADNERGGVVYTCDTKRNCDAIYAYFDALKALAGPYLYQSPSGVVVLQLNSNYTPTQAKQFEDVVKALP